MPYVVHRPRTCFAPLSSRNRIIKLFAAFNAGDGLFRRPGKVGDPVWWGIFDAGYTQQGDYMVSPARTYFVAAQAPLLPVQCILTNCVLTIKRPGPVIQGGYSGMVAEAAETILDGWPASLVSVSTRISGSLPETRFGNWSALLPVPPLMPEVADVVGDDTGRVFVVGAAEQSTMGVRLSLREVAA
jgi:hypothetical protein